MIPPSELSQIYVAAARRSEAVAELAWRICEVPAPTGNEWERARLAAEAITWLGIEPKYEASSTDANIPISLNIPAVCIGITQVERAHTLEEFLYVPPIGDGLAQLTRLCIEASTLIANT